MAVSEWIQLPDNRLIIGDEGSFQQEQNENPSWVEWRSWMGKVIRRNTSSAGRYAAWGATEVLGGDDPNDARSCCWYHALHGDYGGQIWNGDQNDVSNTSPAVCLDITGSGLANANIMQAGYTITPAGEGGGMFARFEESQIRATARALFFGPVRDNLGPLGVLAEFPDPADVGFPPDASFEIEGGFTDPADLVSVELTTDWFGEQPEAVDATNSSVIGVNFSTKPQTFEVMSDIGPGNGEYGQWPHGLIPNGNDGDEIVADNYLGGDSVWQTFFEAADGTTGWENVVGYNVGDSDGSVDEMAVIYPWNAYAGVLGEIGDHVSFGDIALRFTLRPRRIRWVTEGDEATALPPLRILGRQSPSRAYASERAFGAGPRVIGSYL